MNSIIDEVFKIMSQRNAAVDAMEKTGVDTNRVFDWHKAAILIKERRPSTVDAGLQDDLYWTGGCIFRDGKPDLESGAFLASIWACPVIILDGEEIECYIDAKRAEELGWNAYTIWPQSALDILNG